MMKQLFRSATLASTLLFLAATSPGAEALRLKLSDVKLKAGSPPTAHLGVNEDGRLHFYSGLTGEWKVKVPADGEYTLHVSASCQAALGVNANFKVTVDDKPAGDEVKLTTEEKKEYTLKLTLKSGETRLGITFTNDAYKEGEYDRNLFIHALSLEAKK